MPELPEVEIVKQSLNKSITGKIIKDILIKNRNLRFKIPKNFEKKIVKKKIIKVDRFSKHLILKFEDSSYLMIHLGMSGTIHLIKNEHKSSLTNLSFYNSPLLPKKHNHIEIQFKDLKIIYNDPRRFGFFRLISNKKLLLNKFNHLGPEPFFKNFDLKTKKSSAFINFILFFKISQ